MTGQKNTEGKFEKEWRDSLDGAEVTPPSAVWGEIDRNLAYAELSVYKSRNLYYKWAVAAILLIAVSLSTFQFLYFQSNEGDIIADYIQILAPENVNQGTVNVPSKIIFNEKLQTNNISRSRKTSLSGGQGNSGDNKIPESKGALLAGSFEDESVFRKWIGLAIDSKKVIALANIEQSYDQVTFYKIPVYHFERTGKSNLADKYWAGLDVGSGSFDPNFQSGGSSLVAQNLDFNPAAFSLTSNELLDTNSPTMREGMTAGESVSLGVNFGLKLSKRWSLQSGLQYARSGSTTETNVVIQSTQINEGLPATSQAKSVTQYLKVVEEEAVVEYDYRDVSLRNQFQFASVPVTAGYRLLDQKFSLQLNAGLITNFYMGNRLEGIGNEIAELTIGPGDESPYKNVSFSGLAGIEFGYQFMKNFDLIIEPNYRQGINNLTKDGSNFSTNPSGFGLLTGIRYNFN